MFRRTWQAVGRDWIRCHARAITSRGVSSTTPTSCSAIRTDAARVSQRLQASRARRSAAGDGNLTELVCPYHGWTYRLDGRLSRAPRLGQTEVFDRERFSLKPAAVEAWGPLIFISPGDDPESLEQQLAPLAPRLAASKTAELAFVARRSYELRCNWKVYVDNYLDGGYHVSVLHKALAGQLDLDTYVTGAVRGVCRFSRADRPEEAPPRPAATSRSGSGTRRSTRSFIPTSCSTATGRSWIRICVVPLGHDRTRVIFDFYFRDTEGPTREGVHRAQHRREPPGPGGRRLDLRVGPEGVGIAGLRPGDLRPRDRDGRAPFPPIAGRGPPGWRPGLTRGTLCPWIRPSTCSCPAPSPLIIQGGMGAGVSNWVLARAVALKGQLGVVSGTVIDTIVVRRLQDGDQGGHVRRAMAKFPMPEVSAEVLTPLLPPGGRKSGEPYRLLPMYRQSTNALRQRITMLANFVEVHLAKEGHDGTIGINLLTKVQMPNLASLYGAMLAGVDYVLMGAGIPKEIPGVLDALAEHKPTSMKFDASGLPAGETEYLTIDPREHGADRDTPLNRPKFLPIVSSHTLAASLAHKANGKVDGFVFEAPPAGGHNAPPRGELKLNDRGEPIYGDRDIPDFASGARPGTSVLDGGRNRLRGRLARGAARRSVRDPGGNAVRLLRRVGAVSGDQEPESWPGSHWARSTCTRIRESPRRGSPSRSSRWKGADSRTPTASAFAISAICAPRSAISPGSSTTAARPSPVEDFVAKGGTIAETEGRGCLCNALLANIGHGQARPRDVDEKPLLTSGDDLVSIWKHLGERARYAASDVVDYLLSGIRRA